MIVQYKFKNYKTSVSKISIYFNRYYKRHSLGKENGNILSLDDFIYRSQVLKFYRKVIRTCYEVNDKDQTKDLIEYARGEFRLSHQYQNLKDAKLQRNYVLSNGKNHFRDLCKSLGLMGVQVDND